MISAIRIAFRADTHHADGDTSVFLNEFDVFSCVFRKVFILADRGEIFFPAIEIPIDRFCAAVVFQACRIDLPAVEVIGNTYRNSVQTGQNIDLGQCEISQSIDPGCLFQNRQVHPAESSRSARDGSVFSAFCPQFLCDRSEFFRDIRTFADSGAPSQTPAAVGEEEVTYG